VKVLIKTILAVVLCFVWASLDTAYADHKPVKSPGKHLKLKNKTALSKDAKSLPVSREEPAARVTEPSDATSAK
jgi:hypothetical protein